MPTLRAEELTSFTAALLTGCGVPEGEAVLTARSLVQSNLCGHDSHGVIRVVQYAAAIADGRLKPGAPFRILRETPALVAADGGWGLGQVQAHRLLGHIIPKARLVGLAAGTLKQCGHIGRLGEYAEEAAAQQLAFVATVNNHGFGRAVAPPGGTQGRIGTNPICIGVPTSREPVVLDIGTSVCAEGKVRVAFNKGQQLPEGFVLDEHGRPTTDPGVLYREPRGSILPLGGPQAYKGFGLGLLLDMFAGGFTGAKCSHPEVPNLSANAVFFLVLDINAFAGADHFLREVTGLADSVKNCPRADDVDEILVPGDPERKQAARRAAEGIPVDAGTWKQLVELAGKVNAAVPDAPA